MNTTTRTLGIATVALALVGSAAAFAPAEAKGNGAVSKRVSCSAHRTVATLKAKPRNGVLEVEMEVDSNRNGQRWSYTLRHDGSLVATGRRTTLAPSGSFTVRRTMRDAAGAHRVTATAKNLRTGETCRVGITI